MTRPAPSEGIPILLHSEQPRRGWMTIPATVRARVEEALQSPITNAITTEGGFSQGVAAHLLCANGQSVFCKAISLAAENLSAMLYEREARIVSKLPSWMPAPRLLLTIQHDNWLVLIFEYIAGRMPAQPWHLDEAEIVLQALEERVTHADPSPIAIEHWDELHPTWYGWGSLQDEEYHDHLTVWAQKHLTQLVALEADLPGAARGSALIHADVRADNLLLRGREVFFVDWAWAMIAAPWIDLMLFCIAGAVQGLGDPDMVFLGQTLGQQADPDAVTVVLAALAGMYTFASLPDDTTDRENLRRFQAAEARIATRWLAQRTGWR